jgi:hypothetical protein
MTTGIDGYYHAHPVIAYVGDCDERREVAEHKHNREGFPELGAPPLNHVPEIAARSEPNE